uniref:glycosyl hydrolase n=1 Tax=uncultured Draconibacterium sp. TaxID=1573823 RepID=UPI00321781AC
MNYTHSLFFLFLFSFQSCQLVTDSEKSDNTCKPWVYWWWMGSAVDKEDLKIQLNEFAESGVGGVHIVPIYGVQENDRNDIPFLSEKWMEMVDYTICEANKVGLGVDITLGTGWPYGGPFVEKENAAKKLQVETYDLGNTSKIVFDRDSINRNQEFYKLQKIFAVNQEGESIDLEPFKSKEKIECEVPSGSWKLVFLGAGLTKQKVKRAAPGGEGLVMDYFDNKSVKNYLNHFDSVFSNFPFEIRPRAIYHDSYEVYRADWTTNFFGEFEALRGYDLSDVLPVFLDEEHPEHQYVKCDVRETLSDLLLTSFTRSWSSWAHERNFETRNQAHGSPGNILDYYAEATIPETESFGSSQFSIPGVRVDEDYEEERFGRPSPLMMKFASSPAHLYGKKWVSSETTTWLGNHFKVALSQVKPQVDELLVSGINHIFYHGATYSPVAEEFPGWLFYASTNFGRNAHFKEELPRLNEYIYNCQLLLQNSTPDNDILLYFPIHDLWTKDDGELLLQLDVHKWSKWFGETAFGDLSKLLWEQGYSYDYISDRQIAQLRVNDENKLLLKGSSTYSVVVVPELDFISKETLTELEKLVQQGATVVFAGDLPKHFAGYKAYLENRPGLSNAKQKLAQLPNVYGGNEGVLTVLDKLKVRNEKMKLQGLDFIRKKKNGTPFYFVTNLSDRFYEDSLSLSGACNFLEIYDPLANKRGFVDVEGTSGAGKTFLQLPPGKSCFLFPHQTKPDLKEWKYSNPSDTIVLSEKWSVKFISGNTDKLAGEYNIQSLLSWTEWGDSALLYFSGKAKYASTFSLNGKPSPESAYLLCLDDVRESAEVWINGINVGVIWSVPFQIEIPGSILKAENQIEIIVQNLSVNKIIAIDKAGTPWKKFKEINFVDIKYKPFDASDWEPSPSGIIGEVYLAKIN